MNMTDQQSCLSKIWQNLSEYLTGEDHQNGLFHLTPKQYEILQSEYMLVQHYEAVYTLYVENGISMPTENYHVRKLDGTRLRPEDILAIEHKRKAIKRGEYPATTPLPRL